MIKKSPFTPLFTAAVIITLAAAFYLPSFAYGGPWPLARIVSFEGSVFIKSRTIKPLNEWVPLKNDMPVSYFFYNRDVIRTDRGKADIRFFDGDVVRLAENTALIIDEGVRKRQTLGRWTNEYQSRAITLSYGSIFISTKKGGNKTEIELPLIMAAIEGTNSSFAYDPKAKEAAVRCDKDTALELNDIGGRVQIRMKNSNIKIRTDSEDRFVIESVSGKQTILSRSGIKAYIDTGDKIVFEDDGAEAKAIYESKTGDVIIEAPNGSGAQLNSGEQVEVRHDAVAGTATYESLSGNITVVDGLGKTTLVGSGGILTVR